MKKIFFSCLFAGISLLAAAQTTIYDANAQVRTVKGFHGIKVSSGVDLYLSNGDEAIAVSGATAEYRDRIKTEVENGILKIGYEWKEGGNIKLGTNKKLKAYVSFKTLHLLHASGGSDIAIEGIIKGNSLEMNISGGSDFKGAVAVQDLKIDQSGGSDVVISGSAARVSIEASGGSDFKGYNLVTEVCSAEASGGSDIEITVNKDLSAEASGGSDVTYKGTAAVKMTRSGGGSVKKGGR